MDPNLRIPVPPYKNATILSCASSLRVEHPGILTGRLTLVRLLETSSFWQLETNKFATNLNFYKVATKPHEANLIDTKYNSTT